MRPDEPDAQVGRTLADRYRLDALLAVGGMARVYRARDLRLERDVAVKVLSRPFADDPAFTERFLEEARTAAGIAHASLVHVYDSGSDGPHHFIVMELLDRHRTLRQVIAERGPLTTVEAITLGRRLLAGLQAVHARGLVHCDVKARNVMVSDVDGAKLIDFGIARGPRSGEATETSIGSLGYMAPEQLDGAPLTPATDIFALGVVLYEALTGRLPFGGSTPEEVRGAQRRQEVRPPSTLAAGIPPRLDAAILQALRSDPRARFDSAEAMDRALQASVAERDEEATQVVRRRAVSPSEGYVPPVLPADGRARVAPSPARRGSPPPAQGPSPRQPRRARLARLLGSAAVLAGVALVVALVVVPILQSARQPGGGGAVPTASPVPTAPPAGEIVSVPDVVGSDTLDAIEAATEAGLNWTIRCQHDESQPPGIIAQDPPAGTEVARGSAFEMRSARIGDCED